MLYFYFLGLGPDIAIANDDRTLLGGVDGLTGKHGVTALCHTALARQVHQQRLGRGVDAVFGQIGKNMGRGLAEFGEALGVGFKGAAHIQGFAIGVKCLLQRSPGGGMVTTGHIFPITQLTRIGPA